MASVITISKPIIQKDEYNAVKKVLKSGMLATGPKTKEFEEKFADLCGTKYAVAVTNGTAALHTALQAAISPGDEVIIPPFTFVATANAVLMAGGKPIFADINQNTYNIDPKQIEKVITKKTKAIMPVNLYGQAADYTAINKIAKKHKLIVIEDAAQSVNASQKNKISGSLGDLACFSLYATKNVMCGEGGIVTTNNKKYFEKMMEFRNHGQPMGKRYEYVALGFNYRISDVLSAIAVEQLKRIEWLTKKRQEIARQYDSAFKDIKGLLIPHIEKGNTHVYHQYTLRVTSDFPKSRDELKKYLEKKGIQSNIYYPIPLYEVSHLKTKNNFPVTSKIVKEVLSIPVHPLLKKRDIQHIIRTIQKIT